MVLASLIQRHSIREAFMLILVVSSEWKLLAQGKPDVWGICLNRNRKNVKRVFDYGQSSEDGRRVVSSEYP